MQNGILGENFTPELPQTKVDESDLVEERNRAKFSRTSEFKKLKEDIELRIKFYQSQLPGGGLASMTDMEYAELGKRWQVATSIISELKDIIGLYEQAQGAVSDALKP